MRGGTRDSLESRSEGSGRPVSLRGSEVEEC